MATQKSNADYLADQLGRVRPVILKKMFGEYGIFCDGKMVALICDDTLFIKPTLGGKAFVGMCEEGSPYPGAKPHLIIPGEKWDDHEWLGKLIAITTDEAPLPVKKRKK